MDFIVFVGAMIKLFAIVDPIGNLPIFLEVAERIPPEQTKKAFNTAVIAGIVILLVFAFAGQAVLTHVFGVTLHDLQIAGGIVLVILAIEQLLFSTAASREKFIDARYGPYELGAVPLACPLLAGPGAMVTSLTTLREHGPVVTVAAILTVFAILWVIVQFIEPLNRFLGRLITRVISKIMWLFIAAIGVHMALSGLQTYIATFRLHS
jgi:multiple antibiotic resistance protein